MAQVDLDKEINNINKFYGNSSLLEHLEKTVKLKNDSYTLGILVFTAGNQTGGKGKAPGKAAKDKRKKITKYFRENKKKISLGDGAYILVLPDQLAAVVKWVCRAPGFGSNMSVSAANELFSIVAVSDGRKDVAPVLRDMCKVLDTLGPLDKSSVYGAELRFAKHKLKQITPLPIGQTVQPGEDMLLVPDDLKEFQRTWSNYRAMDKKSAAVVEPGLCFLERLSIETIFPVRAALLSSGLETLIKTPARQSALHFAKACGEIEDKINPGSRILDQNTAGQFHRFRLALSPGGGSEKDAVITLTGSESDRKLVGQMENFYRAMLRKAIDDRNFLLTALPKLRTSLKKELKKQQASDEKWTRFPWKLFARIAQKSREEF